MDHKHAAPEPLSTEVQRQHRAMRSFFQRRLRSGMPRGAQLTVNLLLSLIAFVFFLVIAWTVQGTTSPPSFDAFLAEELHKHAVKTPDWVVVFHTVTKIGSLYTIAAVSLLIALVFVWHRRYELLVVWLAAILGTGLLGQGLKELFGRERPRLSTPLAVEQSAGFPSGHALGTIVCYGLLAYLLVRRCSRLRH